MAGPWEKYGAPTTGTSAPVAGPWAKYGAPAANAVPETAAAPAQADAPWYAQAGQAADDIVRLIANGASFGYADKLAGYMGGEGTEAERARSEGARNRAGSAGLVAELGGAAAVPVIAGGAGLSLAGRLGTGAMTGPAGLAARSGLMAAEGAGYGALSAAGHDQDIGTGAALGAVGGALGNVAGEGISAAANKIAGAFNPAPAIPTVDDLAASARHAYQQAENAGVIYSPQATTKLRDGVFQALTDIGYDPALQPGAAAVVRRLEDLGGQNVTVTGLDALRKVANNGYIPGNRSNNMAIGRIIDQIDNIAMSADPADVIAGNGPAAAQALGAARDAWSRVAKVGRVEDAVSRADLRAASTGSGGNANNATRQNLRRIAENPRGFTPDEQAALQTAVRGTPTQNMLRTVGKLSPGGNGLMTALGIGGTIANPAIGGVALGGMGAKYLADRATQGNVDDLIRVILAGGSRAATQAAPNAAQQAIQASRDDLIRAIVGASGYEAGQ